MKRYGAIWFVVLLVVPALLAGMALYRWLNLEQDRIERSVVTAAEEMARTVAENIQLTVEDLAGGLLKNLAALPPATALDELRQWEERNPLIRHVFVWQETTGLIYPDLNRATEAERRFAARYAALFRDGATWSAPPPDVKSAEPDPQAASPRREVRQLLQEDESRAGPEGGWIPWFEANQLHLLGWVASGNGTRYGVEVETMALVSRLAALLPSSMPPGQSMAVLDAGGQVIYQRGDIEILPAMPRVATVQLAPALPHWEVVVFQTGNGLGAAGRRMGRMLLAVLVCIFVLVPISGGALLLRQSQRDARDARRKTSFVSNVSHELKTPLTTIRMYAEMLEEGRVHDEQKRSAYLATIVRESQRLTRLVNNVLDFSRMEQGRKKYAPQDFDAAEVVANLLREQHLRLEQAGLQLTADVTGSCPVHMDRDAFEQSLLNLVDNAIKYAAAGGTLSVELSGNAVRICDNGPGIPAPLRQKVFERFFRVDDSLTSSQPGSGLGLTIARRLMQDQGGDVVLEPSGRGACFVIQLSKSTPSGGTAG